jgi:hypothetical protein
MAAGRPTPASIAIVPSMPGPDPTQLFVLSLLGGPVERRYRRLRPEVERLPWGTLDATRYSPELVLLARRSWTEAAFQEHRTGAACSATLQALIAALAPLDLIAVSARFPLDEMVHVELCARLATELGGGVPLLHDPCALVPRPTPGQSALMEAAELVVRFFCVGEAISIPLLRGTFHAAKHALVRAVLGRIVKDEAAHGEMGFWFLDWARPRFGESERRALANAAAETIAELEAGWGRIERKPLGSAAVAEVHALGWMDSAEYLRVARRALDERVRAPLRERGIAV